MLDVKEFPVTVTPISIILLPTLNEDFKPVAANVNDIPAVSSPILDDNEIPDTEIFASPVTDEIVPIENDA